jgi:predicted transposase YdaD
LTGELSYYVDRERGRTEFAYEVVRLWRQPVKRFLDGPVGALPLAVLAEMPGGESPRRALPNLLRAIDARVTEELQTPQIADLWAAMFVLSGLRLPRDQALSLFKGIPAMKESTTYQYLLEEGRKEGMEEGIKEGIRKGIRATILLQGEDLFGKASATVLKKLRNIDDLDRLQRISKNLHHVNSWKELLETK